MEKSKVDYYEKDGKIHMITNEESKRLREEAGAVDNGIVISASWDGKKRTRHDNKLGLCVREEWDGKEWRIVKILED